MEFAPFARLIYRSPFAEADFGTGDRHIMSKYCLYNYVRIIPRFTNSIEAR